MNPVKYRKRPVVIEAMGPLDMDNPGGIIDWCGAYAVGADDEGVPDDAMLAIETLEGIMYASLGDFIVKGVEGEFYPCKPSIFYATYERALSA